jgi:hypothetical protein
VRGSYSEHITGLGDALSCMENNENAPEAKAAVIIEDDDGAEEKVRMGEERSLTLLSLYN